MAEVQKLLNPRWRRNYVLFCFRLNARGKWRIIAGFSFGSAWFISSIFFLFNLPWLICRITAKDCSQAGSALNNTPISHDPKFRFRLSFNRNTISRRVMFKHSTVYNRSPYFESTIYLKVVKECFVLTAREIYPEK